MISRQQISGFLMTASLAMMLSVGIISLLGVTNIRAVNSPKTEIRPSQTQVSTMNKLRP